MDLTTVVKAHVNLRDARNTIRKDYEAQDEKLKAAQTRLEALMLDFLQQNNMDSVRTEAGTFYRQEEIKPSASDWSAFYEWIKQNDAFDALEKRVTKTFIKDYMEQHEGGVPPGISVYREYVVRIRRGAGT